MNLKEAVEILKKDGYWGENKNVKAFELILSFAISKLSLLEQVEECGVEKKPRINSKYKTVDFLEQDLMNIGFNSAIDLCNAHWVKKLDGIWEVIQKAILYYQVNEASISVQYLKDNPKSLIDCLSQAIITYLAEKEE